jgi:hypothetical protein
MGSHTEVAEQTGVLQIHGVGGFAAGKPRGPRRALRMIVPAAPSDSLAVTPLQRRVTSTGSPSGRPRLGRGQ